MWAGQGRGGGGGVDGHYMFVKVRFLFVAFATVCVWADKVRQGSGVYSFDMQGQTVLTCKAFATAHVFAGEGSGRIRVDGLDMFVKVRFLFVDFAAAHVFAGEGFGRIRVDGLDMFVKVIFFNVAFATARVWAGEGRVEGVDVFIKTVFCSETAKAKWAVEVWRSVCVFDQQVVCHGLHSFGSPLAQAAQERGWGAD